MRVTRHSNFPDSSDSSSSDRSLYYAKITTKMNRRKIQTRSKVKNAHERINTFSMMKVNGSVLSENKNMAKKKNNDKDECKEISGLKQVYISLEDCFKQKHILNDISLIHNVPLIYRIENKKRVKRIKRKSDSNNIENIVVNVRKRRRIIRDKDSSSTESIPGRRTERCTSLQNVHGTDSILISDEQNECELVHNAKEISSELRNFWEHFSIDYSLKTNKSTCTQKLEIEEMNVQPLRDPENDNLVWNVPSMCYQARCNDNDFSIENNNNIIPSTPKIGSPISLTEKQDWIIDIKNAFQGEISIHTDQIDSNAAKILKSDESHRFQLYEVQAENVNPIDNSASSLIFEKTSPQTQNAYFNESMSLTYVMDTDFEERFIDSQLKTNEDVSSQEQENNKNLAQITMQDSGFSQQSNVTSREETQINNEMDDYISLDADVDELEFSMSDSTIENYCEMNKTEFNKICNDENNDVMKNTSASRYTALTEHNYSSSQFYQRNSNIPNLSNNFRTYCFRMIRSGDCNTAYCKFKHNFLPLFDNWYFNNEQHLYKVIEELQKCDIFLRKHLYYPLLHKYCLSDVIYVLKILKKLFEIGVIKNVDALQGITTIIAGGCTIKILVEKLVTIVDNRDSAFVNWISKVLIRHIGDNEHWNTLRSLLLKVDNLDIGVIETILRECRTVQTNINDVNKNILEKLDSNIRSHINEDLLSCFKTSIDSNNNVQKNVRIIHVETIKSPSSSPVSDQCMTTVDQDKCLQAEDIVYETRPQSRNGREDKNIPYILHPIDDLPKPSSLWTRKIFWKLDAKLYCLQKGLEHNDYEYTMDILNSVQKVEKSSISRAFYQILCNEIKWSPHKLTRIATSAVQTGATAVSYEILIDVTILILGNVVKEKLWVLAYRLIKHFHILIESQMQLYKFNAATVLLFAKIYLENNKAIKAFTLVKRTNIIYTNRCVWKVESFVEDSATRVKIIILLINTFCETFPCYGLGLFQLIAKDQCKKLYPIDLNSLVNKLVLSVVSTKDHDMIIDVVKLIMRYGFMLNRITFSTLLIALFHVDMNLAKRMYKFAIALGMYSRLQFHPVTYCIVNVNWSREEIHLAILNSLDNLVSNIGHAIEHVKARDCCIRLIFEDIPTDKRLSQNRISDIQNDQMIKKTRQLITKLLKEEFHPPIFFTNKKLGRVNPLSGISVLTHIKCNYS